MSQSESASRFALRSLPFMVRLGLTGLIAALGIGLLASLQHLKWHYENRDDQKGFTLDDVKSAYHGLDAPSKLLTSLKAGHPPEMNKDIRELLIKWVESGRVNEDYDNIDLGVASPREAIATNCLSCHSAAAAPTKGAGLKLDGLEDIRKIAFARKVEPNSEKIVVMSLHAHGLSMATMSLVLAAMLWFSRCPRGLCALLIALNGVSLPLDLSAWWFSRQYEGLVNLIVVSGGIYNATFGLMLLVVTLELWWPKRGLREP